MRKDLPPKDGKMYEVFCKNGRSGFLFYDSAYDEWIIWERNGHVPKNEEYMIEEIESWSSLK